jgi:hypothetical protein
MNMSMLLGSGFYLATLGSVSKKGRVAVGDVCMATSQVLSTWPSVCLSRECPRQSPKRGCGSVMVTVRPEKRISSKSKRTGVA